MTERENNQIGAADAVSGPLTPEILLQQLGVPLERIPIYLEHLSVSLGNLGNGHPAEPAGRERIMDYLQFKLRERGP